MAPFDDAERPTEPDIAKERCPACKGEGKALRQLADGPGGHRYAVRVCALCNGAKVVGRAAATEWRAEQKRR